MVLVTISHNIVSPIWRKTVLAIDLGLTTATCAGTGPNVNVVFAALPVLGALGAGVLEAEVLLGVGVPDNLALLELARGGGHGAGVVVGALATGGVAAAAIVWVRCE